MLLCLPLLTVHAYAAGAGGAPVGEDGCTEREQEYKLLIVLNVEELLLQG